MGIATETLLTSIDAARKDEKDDMGLREYCEALSDLELQRIRAGQVGVGDFYEAYATWCDERSRPYLALPTFGREIRVLGFCVIRHSGTAARIGLQS